MLEQHIVLSRMRKLNHLASNGATEGQKSEGEKRLIGETSVLSPQVEIPETPVGFRVRHYEWKLLKLL